MRRKCWIVGGEGKVVHKTLEDPLLLMSRLRRRVYTAWLRRTYPFAKFGKKVSVDQTCEIQRSVSVHISIGNNVYLAPGVWLNVVSGKENHKPNMVISDGCRIGRRSMISCHNQVILEADILTAPSVLIMDHNHEFSDPARPIHTQGLTAGGRVVIERNCWIGYGAVILCSRGLLVIGRNSVIGANAVVTRSCPPFSVVAGNPSKLIRKYDQEAGEWVPCGQPRD
jgi:acetyltransferase-like isoleucine patch superfamily enzyme